MPRPIPQRTDVGELLKQHQAAAPAGWDGATPKWSFPKKARNIYTDHMKDRTALGPDWREFYDAPVERSIGICDTSRKHLFRADGAEEPWRPCYKQVEKPEPLARAYGKRAVVSAQHRPPHEEEGDVPRGKKHIEPPRDLLPAEMPMFQLRHKVTDPRTGGLMSQRIADPTLPEPPRGPKRVAEGSDRRGGLPHITPGDKPYSAVEVSNEYMASLSAGQRPRMSSIGGGASGGAGAAAGGGSGGSSSVLRDRFAARQRMMESQREISEVRCLPDIGGVGGDD